jgi:hypothetical protein
MSWTFGPRSRGRNSAWIERKEIQEIFGEQSKNKRKDQTNKRNETNLDRIERAKVAEEPSGEGEEG